MNDIIIPSPTHPNQTPVYGFCVWCLFLGLCFISTFNLLFHLFVFIFKNVFVGWLFVERSLKNLNANKKIKLFFCYKWLSVLYHWSFLLESLEQNTKDSPRKLEIHLWIITSFPRCLQINWMALCKFMSSLQENGLLLVLWSACHSC